MSIQKAASYYKSLSPQQQQFVDEKTISATMSIRKWKSFLAKAAAYDTYGDKAIKKVNSHLLIAGVVGFILFFFLIGLGGYFLIGYLLVLAGILFFLIRRRNLFNNRNLNNYLRLFFFPFLDIMEAKAGPEAKLAASLDFRDPRKALTPEKSKVNKRNRKLYQPKYIIGKVGLLDKTQLEFVVADDIQDFSYWKTTARGKRKQKRKLKMVHHYAIKMAVDKSQYQLKPGNLPAHVQMEENSTHWVFKAKQKAKVPVTDLVRQGKIKPTKLHVLPVNKFFQLVQEVYDFLEAKYPPKEISQPSEETAAGSTQDTDNLSGLAALPLVVWTGTYFDDYDYDSFEVSDEYAGDYEEGGATVFDS